MNGYELYDHLREAGFPLAAAALRRVKDKDGVYVLHIFGEVDDAVLAEAINRGTLAGPSDR